MQDAHLRSLIQAFMADPQIAQAYRNAPAAKTLHHAYIGGLLDHVVSLFRSCDLACATILRSTAILCSRAHFFTTSARFTNSRSTVRSPTPRAASCSGTWSSSSKCFRRSFSVPGFPDGLKILLEHMIISHHGQYEFGSPKLPMFRRLSCCTTWDDLDSKMESMRAHFEREAGLDSPWSSLQRFARAVRC